MLTVYGIETTAIALTPGKAQKLVATVLTVYGIETFRPPHRDGLPNQVATVLTVYGIETVQSSLEL